MSTHLTDDELAQRLSTSLTAVAEALAPDPVPTTTETGAPGKPKRRARRRAALVGAGALVLGAPIGAVAWMGSTPDWTESPAPPDAIEILRVGDEEVWLAHGDGPKEDVQVLSEDSHGPEWGAFTMRRHADAPVSELDWGAILLGEEEHLVFYTAADKTVDSLRVVVDGAARQVTSHPVGNGSYAIFEVDPAAERMIVTPLRDGAAIAEARIRMDVPKP